jgi:hypothetical protein
MSHPFHKSANNTSGLPSRVSYSIWEKLKKYAHDVWEIGGSEEDVVAVRKRKETTEIDRSQSDTQVNSGDLVLLLLGGRKLEGRVLARWDDGSLSIVTDEGYLDNVAEEWVEKVAQEEDSSSVQQGVPSRRAITRDDMGVQNTSPENLSGGESETVDQLQHLLDENGGSVILQVSPIVLVEVKSVGSGQVEVRVLHNTLEVAHQAVYPSLANAVKSIGLSGWYKEYNPSKYQKYDLMNK